ncbi:hypothetical protein J4E91_008699 [Alternaria rosae]|nr:hypothetical protein J4E91_008699 [Alternaria rosae]
MAPRQHIPYSLQQSATQYKERLKTTRHDLIDYKDRVTTLTATNDELRAQLRRAGETAETDKATSRRELADEQEQIFDLTTARRELQAQLQLSRPGGIAICYQETTASSPGVAVFARQIARAQRTFFPLARDYLRILGLLVRVQQQATEIDTVTGINRVFTAFCRTQRQKITVLRSTVGNVLGSHRSLDATVQKQKTWIDDLAGLNRILVGWTVQLGRRIALLQTTLHDIATNSNRSTNDHRHLHTKVQRLEDRTETLRTLNTRPDDCNVSLVGMNATLAHWNVTFARKIYFLHETIDALSRNYERLRKALRGVYIRLHEISQLREHVQLREVVGNAVVQRRREDVNTFQRAIEDKSDYIV